MDLLLGGGDNNLNSYTPGLEVKVESNSEPLVDLLSGSESQPQGEEDSSAHPPTSEQTQEPLLDLGAGGDTLQTAEDPSTQVQDPFSSQFDSSNTTEHGDSSADLLIDTTSADGETNNQQPTATTATTDPADHSQPGAPLEDPSTNPESQPGALEDSGSNPAPAGVEVNVNIDTPEINASSAATADLPLEANNSQDNKGQGEIEH